MNKMMPFEEESNPRWTFYLADGNTMEIRFVMKKILTTGKKNPDGIPIYSLEYDRVVTVFTPEQGYVRATK